MKENTVLLPVEEYNRLRDFENNILESDALCIGNWGTRYYIQEWDLRKEIEEKINEYIKADTLNHADFHKMNQELKDLKEMNIFQFIKWKRKNK